MLSEPLAVAVLLFVGVAAKGQPSVDRKHELPKFLGREVTVTEPERDADGFFPKGPASVCIEAPPRQQCYTAPNEFGNNPSVSIIQVEKGMPALLFSAENGGVSGWAVHFALLRPGTNKELEDLFVPDTTVSNQGQHRFWNESSISGAPIFVTADFVWGEDEGHYGAHQYTISHMSAKPLTIPRGLIISSRTAT